MPRIIYKLFILFSAFLFAACNTAPVTENVSPLEKAPAGLNMPLIQEHAIEGVWEGLVIQGSDLTYIKLDLSVPQKYTSSWQYKGKGYAQSFRAYFKENSVNSDNHCANIDVQLTYNPKIRTFRLKLEHNSQCDRMGLDVRLADFNGVHDVIGNTLTGLEQEVMESGNGSDSRDQHFIFFRSNRFKAIAETFDKLEKTDGVKTGGLFSFLKAPGKKSLRNWAQPLYDEYSGQDLNQGAYSHMKLVAIKLFRDRHFKKYFGERFDDLSVTELGIIWKTLINLKQSSQDEMDQKISMLERMFWTGHGDNAAKQTALRVMAQRFMLNWHHDRLVDLEKLPEEKESLQYIDLFEKELAKTALTLLWPSELSADKKRFAANRKRIALPVLKGMLVEFESSLPTHRLMNRLIIWRFSENKLFNCLDKEDSRLLLDTAAKRLNVVIGALLSPYRQRIENMGSGLEAIEKGNTWYDDFNDSFSKVMQNNLVQKTLSTFKHHRQNHLTQAEDEMLERVRQGYHVLPSELSKSGDVKRLRYIDFLHRSAQKWFAVPGDNDNPCTKNVIKEIAEFGGKTVGLLPPRLAGQTEFVPLQPGSDDKSYQNRFRTTVPSAIIKLGALATSDNLVRKVMTKPVRNAGFQFKSNIIWALFHGRFDELDYSYYSGQGRASDTTASWYNTNPLVHYAFVTYAGLASLKHGPKQIGDTGQVYWYTEEEGKKKFEKQGRIHIPQILSPHYQHSYKLARNVSSIETLFARDGWDFLNMMIDGSEGQVSPKSGDHADETFQISGTSWEGLIIEDLTKLLDYWPRQSYGLWQLQENILRYLKGRPSLQSLYGYRS